MKRICWRANSSGFIWVPGRSYILYMTYCLHFVGFCCQWCKWDPFSTCIYVRNIRTACYIIIKQRAELRLFHFPIFHFFFGLIIIIILLFCHFKLNQKCGGLDHVQSPRWFWQIVDLFDTSTFLFILPILYNKYAHRLMGSSVSEILIRSCLFISLPLHNSRSPNRENL